MLRLVEIMANTSVLASDCRMARASILARGSAVADPVHTGQNNRPCHPDVGETVCGSAADQAAMMPSSKATLIFFRALFWI